MASRKLNLAVVLASCSLFLAAGCASRQPNVYWSRETGPPSRGHFQNLRVADLNRDGLLDIVAGSTQPGGAAVWLGRGDGTWVGVGGPASRGRCNDVALGDVNNDGLPDIVAAGSGELLGVRVWINNDDGTWEESATSQTSGAGGAKSDLGTHPSKIGLYNRIELADVNNDGALDIIAASGMEGKDGGIHVWLGNGANEWYRGGDPVSQGVFRDIVVGDFNRDGNVDVAGTSFMAPGGIYIWYGGGSGEWFDGVPPTDEESFWGIGAGDFNGDGQVDIVAGNYQHRGLYIWYRNKEKGWESPVRLCKDGLYFRIITADFNGDTRSDFAAASFDKGGVEVWIQKDKGWEAEQVAQTYGKSYHGLAVADLNEDGKLDILSVSVKQGIEGWIQTGIEQIITVSPRVAELGSKANGGAAVAAGQVSALPKERSGEAGNSVFTIVESGGRKFAEYMIGARDRLDVTVHAGLEKTTYDEVVAGDGTIFIPDISDRPIEAGGKSPTQLRDEIIRILQTSLKNPRANVMVTGFNSKRATISGEVKITFKGDSGPGQYSLEGMTRLLDFVNKHGGPTDRADTTRVLVIGADGVQRYVNLQKAIETGDASQNIVVDAGDVVYIPPRQLTTRKIYVLGEVNSPGVYPTEGNERILDAVALAKGLNRRAVTRTLYVVRGDSNNPEIRRVDFDALVKRGDYSQNIRLRDGDILYAPQRFITKLTDLVDDVRPLMRTVIDYSDMVTALDNIDADVWHNVGGGGAARARTTP